MTFYCLIILLGFVFISGSLDLHVSASCDTTNNCLNDISNIKGDNDNETDLNINIRLGVINNTEILTNKTKTKATITKEITNDTELTTTIETLINTTETEDFSTTTMINESEPTTTEKQKTSTEITSETEATNHMYSFGIFCIIISIILGSIAVYIYQVKIDIAPKRMQKSNPPKVIIPKPLTPEEIEHALNNHIKLKKGEELLYNITKTIEMRDEVKREFRTLGMVVKDRVSKTLTSDEGRLQINKIRNRYNDIIPYDSNRVTLEKPIGDPPSTYINASPMKFSSTEQTFISTQAPRLNTFGGFWQMVLENKVNTVVMITDVIEGGKRKAEKYWPDNGDFPEIPLENDIKVKYVSDWKLDTYLHRKIIVTDPTSEEEHDIDHLQTTSWMDMQAPNDTNVLLDLLYKVRELATARPGPILVHCSAGVGRTGTFIALYKLTEELAKDDVDELDLFLTTLEMRRQRSFMIQKSEQYMYVFKCLQKYVADKWKMA